MDEANKTSTEADKVEDNTSTNPSEFTSGEILNEDLIKSAFKEYKLQKADGAESVHHFAKFLNIEEAAFYNHFSSLGAINKQIWKDYFDITLSRLSSDEVYLNYTVREKLLAFFYTLFELLKEDRSYIIKTSKSGVLPNLSNDFLEEFKAQYFNYINELIEEGKESGEVAERFLISKQYTQGLWLQFLFILNFWIRDDSKAFEKTDAAIEKSMNFSLDLMGRSAFDSFTDFAKFIYQSR